MREHRLGVGKIVEHAVENSLDILMADKKGYFAVAPYHVFCEKALTAVEKNCKPIDVKASKVKERAMSLLRRHNLEQLARSLKKAKGLHLKPFFVVKTHKPEARFRTIVTEKRLRQLAVYSFLEKHLLSLQLNDPYLIPN
ncbi:hypothetical protein HPB48_006958 [Haemaphysalis longicornis]|uniref:Uncharacterized protein n=1 Tax=Haemaphysalis longicornis TaxID=44386 RepID=A0A9J6GNQ0_HAELO|nr:hypothetical protein HPB48_006958 [Haemaphysalis longicornis]